MDALIIESTSKSPKIILDPINLKFEIAGESRPEHATKFYEPVISWLEKYHSILLWKKSQFGKSPHLTFTFYFSYFNSTSAKFIVDILKQLEAYSAGGCDVTIKWYYDKRDEDMKESGEELSALVDVPFQFIEA